MFAVKIVKKSGAIELYNNPSSVYFDPNYKFSNDKPVFLRINDGAGNCSEIYQDYTQTPLDLIYGRVEKAIEEGGMVTIYLNK